MQKSFLSMFITHDRKLTTPDARLMFLAIKCIRNRHLQVSIHLDKNSCKRLIVWISSLKQRRRAKVQTHKTTHINKIT